MFWGKYGDLSTQEAAIRTLKDFESDFNPQDLIAINDETIPFEKKYDLLRKLKQIEGLQMVILRNGSSLEFSSLPLLWKEGKKYLNKNVQLNGPTKLKLLKFNKNKE